MTKVIRKSAAPAKKPKAAVKQSSIPARKAAPTKNKKQAVATVDDYLAQLDGPLANTIGAIRQVFLKTDKLIGEQIKWNSPAFYYTGDMKPFDPKEYKRDIAVVNIYKIE